MSNQPAVVGPDGVARPYIGGQALIEGVMMRSPHSFAAVVRRRDGSLHVREEAMEDHRKGVKALPLVRGVFTLVEALKLGHRALRFSADLYEKDLEEAEKEEEAEAAKKDDAKVDGAKVESPKKGVAAAVTRTGGPSMLAAASLPIIHLLTADPGDPAGVPEKKDDGEAGKKLVMFISIAFALVLFVALPQATAEGTSRLFDLGLDVRSPGFQLITGAAKLVIIISYMMLIRRMPEIYRVFQYHGAEHKAIYTYERGEDLTVANTRPNTTLHPRCGTTFLVMVALVSIVVFTLIGPFLPEIGMGKLVDNVAFFLMKLPFLPVIAAVTFEIQRVFARYCTKGPLRALLWPGFLVQKVTTIEPDDNMLEIALTALRATLTREAAPGEDVGEKSFESFEAFQSTSLPGSTKAA